MLRQRVLEQWKGCKEKVFKLKSKSIDNYRTEQKRTLLGVNNYFSTSPLTLCSSTILSGSIESKPINWKSNFVVEMDTELLRVAIIERLDDVQLKNYEGEISYSDDGTGPVIEEID